ncbi:OLC1v1014234C1 [Oldenlandia corymbosa var. corymbosa]|uniref:OLC1v1014234C1 n=1 Tax=Oldenlandia corymbosa var. corymbosa TaxID=529605 RepID=A0AAV1E071_OLDCO|nr:OLC1v1014234C1 [Oldenlandia corymbosa var. corymbosa]
MQKMFQNAAEENVRSIKAYVTELKERVAKLQYQKQLLVCQLEANEAAGYEIENVEDLPPIQQDSLHLDIHESGTLRRLTWLQQHLAEIGNASPAPRVGNDPSVSLSNRELKREREFLAKRLKRLSEEEREALYIKWEVPLDGQQRRIQFINKLWRNPHDEKHVHESADIVARLVGLCESGKISKEMFELNFVLPSNKNPWMVGWNQITDLLHL